MNQQGSRPNPGYQNQNQNRRFGGNFQNKNWPPRQQQTKAAAYQTSADDENDENTPPTDDSYQSSGHDFGEQSTAPSSFVDPNDQNMHWFDEGNGQMWEENQGSQYQESGFDEQSFAGFVSASSKDTGVTAVCTNCQQRFESKNKLHGHLRSGCSKKSPKSSPAMVTNAQVEAKIIESTAKSDDIGSGYGFRAYNYVKTGMKMSPDGPEETVCLDTGCGSTLVDRKFLARMKPDATILSMSEPLAVRGVGTDVHKTKEFVVEPMFFPATNPSDGSKILACIRRELHIVENLRANVLIGNDIIVPEDISLCPSSKKAIIGSCGNVAIPIDAMRTPFSASKVKSRIRTMVPPRSEVLVPVSTKMLPADRDLFFESTDQANVAFFAHIVDQKMTHILARNETDNPVEIPAKLNVGKVTDIGYENCFFGNVPYELAMRTPRAWKKRVFDAAMVATSGILAGNEPIAPQYQTVPAIAAMSNVFSTTMSPVMTTFANDGFQNHFPTPENALEREEKLTNGIMVYGNDSERKALSDLVAEYPSL